MARKLLSVNRIIRLQAKANGAFDKLIDTIGLECLRFFIGAKRLVKTPDGRWVDAAKHDSSVSVVGHYPPKSRSESKRERARAEAVFQQRLEEGKKLGPSPKVPAVDHILDTFRSGMTSEDEAKFGRHLDALEEMRRNPPPAPTPPEEPPLPPPPITAIPCIRAPRRPVQVRRAFGLRKASSN